MGGKLHRNRPNSPETLDEFLAEDTLNKPLKIRNKRHSSALPVTTGKCDSAMLKIRRPQGHGGSIPPARTTFRRSLLCRTAPVKLEF